MTFSTLKEEALRKFRKHFADIHTRFDVGNHGAGQEEVDKFLNSYADTVWNAAIDSALEVGKSNQKGTFTDEAGHDAWYIDSLCKALSALKSN